MPRESKFTAVDRIVLEEIIEDNKGVTDRQLCAIWSAKIRKECSPAQFCKIVNSLSKRYAVQRKTLLSEKTKGVRMEHSVDMSLNGGAVTLQTLFCDEKWFSQTTPQTVRCIRADDPARFVLRSPRFNTSLPAARQQVKVLLFGGIAFGKPPLSVIVEGMVDRVSMLEILHNQLLPYMHQHGLKYLYWDNARPHGTDGVFCLLPGRDSNPIQGVLADYGIQQITAPPSSPDLNPIEKVFAESVRDMEAACVSNVVVLNTAQLRVLAGVSLPSFVCVLHRNMLQ